MDAGFEVTERGPNGEPRKVECRAHPGCEWSLQTPNAVSDGDAILRAMFARHLSAREAPGKQASGHQRRLRR